MSAYSTTEVTYDVEWGSGHRWRKVEFKTEGEARVFIDNLDIDGDLEIKMVRREHHESWESEEIPI